MLTNRQYINIHIYINYIFFCCRKFTNKTIVVYRQNRCIFSLDKKEINNKNLEVFAWLRKNTVILSPE